ncbi:P-loop containing nucleoside triphosphate hydrolase protein [Mycena rosella]|uniref:Gluconokinase n=1 Tax=Mycena rosella TaxID=1033263 RepID=A0AAD7F627_MYCRO|nr:P-loop containing nucleoside triphosphate hydrolase protein [Mycena rosella]
MGTGPVFIVVMGVSGTGKSTLGAALAAALRLPYVDGDDLHPRANVEKMGRGEPLTDADRGPWLSAIRGTAERIVGEQQQRLDASAEAEEGPHGVVIACSALKRAYRDVLRGRGGEGDAAQPTRTDHTRGGPAALPTYFVFIDGSREVLRARMTNRTGHFMKAGMLDSQLATLESPRGEEGVVLVSVEDPTATQVENAVRELEGLLAG